MAYISVAVEYALHCLLYLVDFPDGAPSPSARDLAELRALPIKYVGAVMTKTNKAGITVATEGVHGGLRLAKSADQITFLDVVEAVDGPKKLFDCRDVRGRCALFEGGRPAWASTGICSIHAVMLDAEARMKDVLRSKTLRHMADISAVRVPSEFKQNAYAWLTERNATRHAPRGTTSVNIALVEPNRDLQSNG